MGILIIIYLICMVIFDFLCIVADDCGEIEIISNDFFFLLFSPIIIILTLLCGLFPCLKKAFEVLDQ